MTADPHDCLALMMGAAVPLHVMRLEEKGGPDERDMRDAREAMDLLGERGDVLLFGGGTKGECARIFNQAARAAAVLAFAPGGVDVFGQHFEARPSPGDSAAVARKAGH